jgi:hypothetical protein
MTQPTRLDLTGNITGCPHECKLCALFSVHALVLSAPLVAKLSIFASEYKEEAERGRKKGGEEGRHGHAVQNFPSEPLWEAPERSRRLTS